MDRSHIVSRPGDIATLRRERFTRPKPSGASGSTFVLAVVEGPDTGLVITLDASQPTLHRQKPSSQEIGLFITRFSMKNSIIR